MIDTHIHLDDPRYGQDRDDLIKSFPAGGIELAVTVGSNLDTSKAAAGISLEYAHIYNTVGVHPSDLSGLPENFCDILSGLVNTKTVAVGECGLDYHYTPFDKAAQAAAFISHIDLANTPHPEIGRSLPLIVHSREALEDTLSILTSHPVGNGGIIHCFTYGPDAAEAFTSLGYHIAFGGAVTYKKSDHIIAAAKATPRDRILLETDAPYLAPVPFRGKRNDSTLMVHTLNFLAAELGLPPEELEKLTTENAKRLFKI